MASAICVSPDSGSTTNQASCFRPAGRKACPPLSGLGGGGAAPLSGARLAHRDLGPSPPWPDLAPPAGETFTGVEDAVRAAARGGVDQLRDGEGQFLRRGARLSGAPYRLRIGCNCNTS